LKEESSNLWKRTRRLRWKIYLIWNSSGLEARRAELSRGSLSTTCLMGCDGIFGKTMLPVLLTVRRNTRPIESMPLWNSSNRTTLWVSPWLNVREATRSLDWDRDQRSGHRLELHGMSSQVHFAQGQRLNLDELLLHEKRTPLQQSDHKPPHCAAPIDRKLVSAESVSLGWNLKHDSLRVDLQSSMLILAVIVPTSSRQLPSHPQHPQNTYKRRIVGPTMPRCCNG